MVMNVIITPPLTGFFTCPMKSRLLRLDARLNDLLKWTESGNTCPGVQCLKVSVG